MPHSGFGSTYLNASFLYPPACIGAMRQTWQALILTPQLSARATASVLCSQISHAAPVKLAFPLKINEHRG